MLFLLTFLFVGSLASSRDVISVLIPPEFQSRASPYYFGTTNLWCLKKMKRSTITRSEISLTHRFIYYRGTYFEFTKDSKVSISNSRLGGHKCGGGRERWPTAYSTVSLQCIKNCARNYKCWIGKYNLFSNNCHTFANKISEILWQNDCPRWCSSWYWIFFPCDTYYTVFAS